MPVLQGQPADYLLAALKAYAEGNRRSGIMQPLAADLREEDMRNLAEYYGSLPSLQPEPLAGEAALVEIGRKLALEGHPGSGIPPCVACHGSGNNPRLAAQHPAYLAGQLRLWREGQVPGTQGAALMAPIAQRLSDEQIEALSVYFASVPPLVDIAR